MCVWFCKAKNKIASEDVKIVHGGAVMLTLLGRKVFVNSIFFLFEERDSLKFFHSLDSRLNPLIGRFRIFQSPVLILHLCAFFFA